MSRISTRILPAALLALALTACGGNEAADAADRMPRGVASAPEASAPPRDVPATPVQPEEAAAPAVDGAEQAAAPGAPAPAASPSAAPAPSAPAAEPAPRGDASTQDRAQEILRQAERVANGIRTLEADFVQSLNVPLLGQSQRSAGKMYQKRPDRFLMRFTEPAGDVMVADGRHFWIYYPSTDRTQVIRTSISNGAGQVDLQQQFLSNPAQRYVATIAGEEQVAGHATWVLTLVPRGASPYRLLKVWVDRDDHLVRRFEITEENDSVRRVELRNLKINGAVSDDLFVFTPPAGTQVFDQ